MSLDGLRGETGLVVEEARYFHRTCKVAGAVVGTLYSGNHVEVRLKPTGTTDEGILKLQSGQPRLELRVLLCNPACNHEETAEDLVHGLRIRKQRPADGEEPWVNNLEKVAGLEGPDELERLRTEMEERRNQPTRPALEPSRRKRRARRKRRRKRKRKKEELHQRGLRLRGSSPGRDEGQTGIPEKAKSVVRRYGARSLGQSEEPCATVGKEVCEEKGKESQQRLRQHERQLTRSPVGRGVGDDLPASSSRAGDCRRLPRRSGKSSPGTDASEPPPDPGRGRRREYSPSGCSSILPSGIAKEIKWSDESGAPHTLRCLRPLSAREGGTMPRLAAAEGEECRINAIRDPLVGSPKVGAIAKRAIKSHGCSRDAGSTAHSVRGVQNKMDVLFARRQTPRIAEGGRKKGQWKRGLQAWSRWQKRRERTRKEKGEWKKPEDSTPKAS